MAAYWGRMPTQRPDDGDRLALMQGTLDLLILRTLLSGRCHGQGIARAIQRQSDEVEEKGWISAKWGVSENNRRARFYSLTAKGRVQLVEKTSQWRRLARAIGMILGP